MGGDANGNDQDLLDKFLNTVLDRYKDGIISHNSAHAALSGILSDDIDADERTVLHMRAFISHNPRDDL